MKANELRLGNYFTDNENHDGISNYKPINKVIALQKDRIYFIDTEFLLSENDTLEENRQIELSKCLPIPITNDWFLKFRMQDEEGFRHLKGYGWDEGFLYNELDINDMCRINSVKVEYVHQLQNLFFALTGKELM